MRAMVLQAAGSALQMQDLPIPSVKKNHVLIEVWACGVCRTDVHIMDGDLLPPIFPLILGHQIVGKVIEVAEEGAKKWSGKRVGVGWQAWSCGECRYCRQGRENLCDFSQFTGYSFPGGFAEYCTAHSDFLFDLDFLALDSVHAAPLLCAGAIGYRALKMTKGAHKIGLYGFGSSAHLITPIAKESGQEIFAFTKNGEKERQQFAKDLGAVWAGDVESCHERLDAAIIFASDGGLIPTALKAVCKGGCVVCAGIHMSDIPSFPYALLWQERSIQSVANLRRLDAYEFLQLVKKTPLSPIVSTYELQEANEALEAIKKGGQKGSCVLIIRR